MNITKENGLTKIETDFDNEKKQFWKDVFISVSGSNTCYTNEVAKTWADFALKEFEKRFGKNAATNDQY